MKTQKQLMKDREVLTRAKLKQWLHITDDELNEMIFEGAYEYLKTILKTDDYGMESIPAQKQFWDWWRMEWNNIDNVFIAAIDTDLDNHVFKTGLICYLRDRDDDRSTMGIRSVEQLREMHAYYHEATMRNRYINNQIVQASSHRIIKKIINTEKEVING